MISIHSETCMNDLLVMAIMGNPLLNTTTISFRRRKEIHIAGLQASLTTFVVSDSGQALEVGMVGPLVLQTGC